LFGAKSIFKLTGYQERRRKPIFFRTVLRKLETGMAYAIINIILLVAAWICFPHTEQSKGQPITASANASELA
jgi:hypothetical protein